MPERTCPNCGKTSENSMYCPECGEPMIEPLPQEDAAPQDAEADEPSAEVAEPSAPAAPPPPPPPPAAGAELSGSELPPDQPPTAPEPFAPEAAEQAAEAPPQGEQGGVEPETLEPRGPHQEPVVAGATPLQQAAENMPTPAPPMDGQLRCPNCGEAVYARDRVCWNCSRRLEVSEAPTQVSPTQAPPATSAAPESGAPAPRGLPPQAVDRTQQMRPGGVSSAGYPSAAAQPQQRPGPSPSDEAMAYAWWSLGLGLLSVFTCGILGLLGIASLWLGISAARRNAGPVAIAGAVFGAIGLLMLLAWVIGLAIAMPEMMRPSPTHIMLPTFR